MEKILIGEERLPDDWACDGTTGYEVLNRITGLFVDPAGREPLVELFTRLTGVPADYATVVRESKREVLDLFFGAEIDRLHAVVGCRPRAAVVELLAAMPVYRAYAVPGEPPPPESGRDRRDGRPARRRPARPRAAVARGRRAGAVRPGRRRSPGSSRPAGR